MAPTDGNKKDLALFNHDLNLVLQGFHMAREAGVVRFVRVDLTGPRRYVAVKGKGYEFPA